VPRISIYGAWSFVFGGLSPHGDETVRYTGFSKECFIVMHESNLANVI